MRAHLLLGSRSSIMRAHLLLGSRSSIKCSFQFQFISCPVIIIMVYFFMKRKFEQRWSTIPPKSTKSNNHLLYTVYTTIISYIRICLPYSRVSL